MQDILKYNSLDEVRTALAKADQRKDLVRAPEYETCKIDHCVLTKLVFRDLDGNYLRMPEVEVNYPLKNTCIQTYDPPLYVSKIELGTWNYCRMLLNANHTFHMEFEDKGAAWMHDMQHQLKGCLLVEETMHVYDVGSYVEKPPYRFGVDPYGLKKKNQSFPERHPTGPLHYGK